MKKGKIIFGSIAILAMLTGVVLFACGQNPVNANVPAIVHGKDNVTVYKNNLKMKIEIWSDVVCPFCYIGKTKFEIALDEFVEKNQVEIEWKSYQLMPDLVTQPNKTADQVLAESKGWGLEQAKELNGQAAQMGKQAGLEYNFHLKHISSCILQKYKVSKTKQKVSYLSLISPMEKI